MATINQLMQYRDYEFSSGGITGQDYKTFQTKYISYLKSLAKKCDWEIVNVGRNHYCFSAFVKNKRQYIYLSISDVRYFPNEWLTNILYRTATSQEDYHGGQNHYTNLGNLGAALTNLFNREAKYED